MSRVLVFAKDTPRFPALQSRGYIDIEREAQETRAYLGLEPDEPLDCLSFMDRLHALRVGRNREIAVESHVDNLTPGVEAMAEYVHQPSPKILITLSAPTYDGLERRMPRDGHSLLHETGHGVLHYRELMTLTRIPDTARALLRGKNHNLPAYDNAEWQADAYAGSMKMPAAGLLGLEKQGLLDVRNICRRFGSSRASAEIRLRIYAAKRGLWFARRQNGL